MPFAEERRGGEKTKTPVSREREVLIWRAFFNNWAPQAPHFLAVPCVIIRTCINQKSVTSFSFDIHFFDPVNKNNGTNTQRKR